MRKCFVLQCEHQRLRISSPLFWSQCALPAALIGCFNVATATCSASYCRCKDKRSEEEVERSSKPKQEVTGNTEALVHTRRTRTVCLRLHYLKKKRIISLSSQPMRLLAPVHTALYCTYLTFRINREYCVRALRAAVYESRLVHVVATASWWYLVFPLTFPFYI